MLLTITEEPYSKSSRQSLLLLNLFLKITINEHLLAKLFCFMYIFGLFHIVHLILTNYVFFPLFVIIIYVVYIIHVKKELYVVYINLVNANPILVNAKLIIIRDQISIVAFH